MPVADTYWSE